MQVRPSFTVSVATWSSFRKQFKCYAFLQCGCSVLQCTLRCVVGCSFTDGSKNSALECRTTKVKAPRPFRRSATANLMAQHAHISRIGSSSTALRASLPPKSDHKPGEQRLLLMYLTERVKAFTETQTTFTCRCASGWGTALQAGRSRVRFPMVSFQIFIDIILPVAPWPWGWLIL